MRLSEAIRKGSVGMRQVFGEAFDGADGACAAGAAYLGIGLGRERAASDTMYRIFPDAAAIKIDGCPVCDRDCDREDRRWGLTGFISHINDIHRWTFDQIADWVQAQEAIHGIGIEAHAETPELVEA